MFPIALVCGNTMVLKPSERVPGSTMILMELVQQCDIPDGVVNVIHGAHEGKVFITLFLMVYLVNNIACYICAFPYFFSI